MNEVHDETRLANIRLEYSAMVERYSKTIERRDQIIGATLTLTSALLAAAIAYPTTPSIALIYPPIATFLAIEWVYSYILNILMATYIRDHLATQMPGISWEAFLKKWRDQHQGRFRIFAVHGGVFLFTQILAIFIGIAIRPKNQSLDFTSYGILALLLIDCFSIVVTIYYLHKALYDRNVIKMSK